MIDAAAGATFATQFAAQLCRGISGVLVTENTYVLLDGGEGGPLGVYTINEAGGQFPQSRSRRIIAENSELTQH